MASDVDIAKLYDAVYASPDDDAPRLVLADALIERDDPRGQFIALQFARAKGRASGQQKEDKLLKKHAREWLGPLAEAVVLGRTKWAFFVFERGFLSRCTLGGPRLAVGAREWSTVRVLECRGARNASPLLVSEPIRLFTRRITGVAGPAAQDMLASREERRWRELALEPDDVDAFVAALAGAELPHLTSLDLALRALGSVHAERLLAATTTQKLAQLSIANERDDALFALAPLGERVKAGEPCPAQVNLIAASATITLDLRGDQAPRLIASMIQSPDAIVPALRRLEGTRFREVRLRPMRGGGYVASLRAYVPEPDIRALRAAAEQLGPVTIDWFP